MSVQLVPQPAKSGLIERLGEDIRELIICANEGELEISTANVFPDEVVANLNVLRLVVLHGVVCNLDCTLIVAEERHFVNEDAIIPQSFPHPKQLRTTACSSNIFRFVRRDEHNFASSKTNTPRTYQGIGKPWRSISGHSCHQPNPSPCTRKE